ncbi:MAG TPA: hypothetical protein PK109_02560 [Candidatus Paceibacterota bacterium]|nr:hypothetical protein [Candidatus Paceibacterota bacterium]
MTLFSTDLIVNFTIVLLALMGLAGLMISLQRRKPVTQAFGRAMFFGALAVICLLEYGYTTKLWIIGIVLFVVPQLYWSYQAVKLWYQRWGTA